MKIVSSHPTLSWFSGSSYGHRVPAHISSQLARVKTPEQAKAFIRSAGLMVRESENKVSPSAFAVSVLPPHLIGDYYGPEIALPRIDCELIPLGSALLNCLLAPIADKTKAEETFGKYQKLIQLFINRIEAQPFACITGHKVKHPPHYLFERGFRLFFSPAPEMLYSRIVEILKLRDALSSEDVPREKRKEAAIESQNAKFVTAADGRIGHSFLEDVMLMNYDTQLIRLFPES